MNAMTEPQFLEEDHRPWGYYQVLLDEPTYKVKRIVVLPGKRLSYQYHKRRAEHWFVVEGRGIVTRNGERLPVSEGDMLDVPKGTKHRIENDGGAPLAFIEIQRGDYFGEDDIVRVEDDFGRV
jgi:mannose-6-phosphate isomerase